MFKFPGWCYYYPTVSSQKNATAIQGLGNKKNGPIISTNTSIQLDSFLVANLDVSLAQTSQIAPFSNCHRSVRLPGATDEDVGLNVIFFPPRKCSVTYDRI